MEKFQDERVPLTQIRRSMPYHFSIFGHETFVLILVVQSSEEHSIETHLREHGGHFPGVTEGIYLPSNSRTSTLPKGIIQKSANILVS